eukprot:SAG31_NODE_1009_length_10404_cov_27.639981_4_plen_263_part_00
MFREQYSDKTRGDRSRVPWVRQSEGRSELRREFPSRTGRSRDPDWRGMRSRGNQFRDTGRCDRGRRFVHGEHELESSRQSHRSPAAWSEREKPPPETGRPSRTLPAQGGATRDVPHEAKLLVRNIPGELCKFDKLREYFKRFGDIEGLDLQPKDGEATVTFATLKEADEAHKCPDAILGSRFITTAWRRAAAADTPQPRVKGNQNSLRDMWPMKQKCYEYAEFGTCKRGQVSLENKYIAYSVADCSVEQSKPSKKKIKKNNI